MRRHGVIGAGVSFFGAPGGKDGLFDVGLEDDGKVFFGQGAEAEPKLFGVISAISQFPVEGHSDFYKVNVIWSAFS
jgi:hypothetical protein